jgi:2-methylcitrate dehydratase PrpD
MSENKIKSKEIASVVVKGDSHIRAWCEPLAERRKPSNAAAAGNSVPFAVATALVNGKVTPSDFTVTGMVQSDVLAVAERVVYQIDDTLDGTRIVEVTTQNGAFFTAQVNAPLGHLSRPVSNEQLVEKFRNCATYTAMPIRPEALEEVIRLIDVLEDVPDIARLTSLLGSNA